MIGTGRPRKRFESGLQRLLAGAEDVLDIGTSQRFAKELRPYEGWFEGRRYVAAGYQPSLAYGAYNCDAHQDIEAMTFRDDSFDAVICLEVLEHVRHPELAASEIARVLRIGGVLLLTTPFLTSYHGKGSRSQAHEDYPDFWRFTHEGLAALFSSFTTLNVEPLDGPLEVRLRFLRLMPLLERPLRAIVDRLDNPTPGKATSRHLLIGVK
jgi:SAM-dependent methyltransferase